MTKEQEFLNSLSEEMKQKLTACETEEEMRNVLTEAGVGPLDDEQLDAVNGGISFGAGLRWLVDLLCKKYEGYL